MSGNCGNTAETTVVPPNVRPTKNCEFKLSGFLNNGHASTIPTRDTAEFGEAERRGRSLGGCGHAFPINGHAFHFQVLVLSVMISQRLVGMLGYSFQLVIVI